MSETTNYQWPYVSDREGDKPQAVNDALYAADQTVKGVDDRLKTIEARPLPSAGTTADTFAAGNDSRLSDARTPKAHTHNAGEITGLGNAATKNVGTGADTVAAGNDTRLYRTLEAPITSANLSISAADLAGKDTIVFSGTLTAPSTVTIANEVVGTFTVFDYASGAFPLTIRSGGGGDSVTLNQYQSAVVIDDGTNVRLLLLGTSNTWKGTQTFKEIVVDDSGPADGNIHIPLYLKILYDRKLGFYRSADGAEGGLWADSGAIINGGIVRLVARNGGTTSIDLASNSGIPYLRNSAAGILQLGYDTNDTLDVKAHLKSAFSLALGKHRASIGSTTIDADDYCIHFNTSGGAGVDQVLPPALSFPGRVLVLEKASTDSNYLHLAAVEGQNFYIYQPGAIILHSFNGKWREITRQPLDDIRVKDGGVTVGSAAARAQWDVDGANAYLGISVESGPIYKPFLQIYKRDIGNILIIGGDGTSTFYKNVLMQAGATSWQVGNIGGTPTWGLTITADGLGGGNVEHHSNLSHIFRVNGVEKAKFDEKSSRLKGAMYFGNDRTISDPGLQTFQDDDFCVHFNTFAGNIGLYMPDALGFPGRYLLLEKVTPDSNYVDFVPTGTQGDSVRLDKPGSVLMHSYNGKWRRVINYGEQSAQFYDPACQIDGKAAPGFRVLKNVFGRTVKFAANMAGSGGYAYAVGSEACEFSLQKNDVEFGTMVWASGSHTPTFAAPATTFAPGDRLTVVSPANTNNGPADAMFTLLGVGS